MNRLRTLSVLALFAAACSSGSSKPGALFRGPGALAVFDGVVAMAGGTLRPFLAVGNERGDELSLVDLTDGKVVQSPGLAFPLSIPTSGRPMLVASARLGDGAQPDALAVISAGSSALELVDTWSGRPTVISSVDLDAAVQAVAPGATVEVLSMVATPTGVAGSARFIVGLTRPSANLLDANKLAVVTVARPSGTIQVASTTVLPIDFEPAALAFDMAAFARGGTPDVVFAATRDPLPPAFTSFGSVKLTLHPSGTPDRDPLIAGVPTEALAVTTFDAWDFPVPDVLHPDVTPTSVQRVVAVPVADSCGAPPKPVRCGLIALHPSGTVGVPGSLEGDPTGEGPTLLPIAFSAPVTGLLATGRTKDALLPGTKLTTGLAFVSTAEGGVYLVDLLRWRIVSDTSPVSGTGKTRATVATTVLGQTPTSTALGLWPLAGAATADLSAAPADLPGRVRVTPGFTPDDDWTLTWRGTLPGLETRGATLNGTALTVLHVDLSSLGVQVNDRVEIGPIAGYCPAGTEAVVTAVGAAATLGPVPPATSLCFGAAPAGTGAVATLRSGGLILVGARSGLTARPPRSNARPSQTTDETAVAGQRLFYVTDACDADCQATWQAGAYALGFAPAALPSGPSVGISVGFVDPSCAQATVAACAPAAAEPEPGTAIHFTTASGLVPTRRYPIVSGTAVASTLPLGLAILDPGGSLAGVGVYASYTAGLVMLSDTGNAAGVMTVVR